MTEARGFSWGGSLLFLALSVMACAGAPQPRQHAKESAPSPPPSSAPPPPAPVPQARSAQPKSVVVDGFTNREINTAEDAQEVLAAAESELDKLFDNTRVDALAGSRCLRSCRALGSMRRAVDRLCELTDADARCENARRRLERSQRRVSDAGCACS